MNSLSEMKMGRTSEETDNVWSSILSEVRTNSSTKMPSGKSIVVLGNTESGKTTLVAKLQGIDDPKKGSGLEYAYIEIRDEYRDDSAQLGVWVLDGNMEHAHLLKFALPPEKLSESLVLITVSMATPWKIMEELAAWAAVLHDHIDAASLTSEVIEENRNRCSRRWIDYIEPGDDLVPPKTSIKTDEQLPPNTLTRNTGLDIVVVVTKTDCMGTLERESDFREEHFEFIQFHIRQFCLAYGAALFYTSVKEDKNCDLLYKYLVHRVYGLPFRTPALVVEKDALLVPSGWDSEKKMAILYENMNSFRPDDFFNDVIAKPVGSRKPAAREAELDVEDEQRFLERQLALLQQSSGKERGSPKPHSDKRPNNSTSPLLNTTPKKGDATNSERVLANFFNSLLSKKTGSSPNTSKSSDDSRSDAAAELDSLVNKNKLNHSLNSSDC